jgi:hypothetical protein
VAQRTRQEAAGAAGGIEQDFAGARVDPVHHEGGDGARGVILARIAGRLQVIQDLLVDVAEVLALGQIVEIDGVDLVHDLPHELAGLHVVVCVLENVFDHAAAVARLGRGGEILQRLEQLAIDEGEQLLAGCAFRVRRPDAPLVLLGDRRAVVAVQQFQFLVLVIDDL